MVLDDQGNHLDSYAIQFGIIKVLKRSPISQTSNWSGTFFAVSYSKPALAGVSLAPVHHVLAAYHFETGKQSRQNLNVKTNSKFQGLCQNPARKIAVLATFEPKD
jgi:hypothetical protein